MTKPSRRPPGWIRTSLEKVLPAEERVQALLGDLEELYERRRSRGSRLGAGLWYAWEAMVLVFRARLPFGRSSGARSRTGLRLALGLPRALLLAARRLVLRSPGFTAAAVLTLTIGMGAATLVFGVYHGVVLTPLPYPEAERLIVIEHPLPGFEAEGEVPVIGGLLGQALHYRERATELTAVGAYWSFEAAITDVEAPEYVRIGGATEGFFRALGVQPGLGRLFDGTELDPTVPGVEGLGQTILSHALWSRRYGAAPDILGTVVQTQGYDYEIVGVAPSAMPFPPEGVAVWNPVSDERIRANPDWSVAGMVGRMAPGATPESVKAQLDGLIRELPRRFEQPPFRRVATEARMHARVTPLKAWLLGDAARSLEGLLLAALAVLVIAAVNVTNLLVVRAEACRGEVAVRRALGAGRAHVAGYFLGESVILMATAGTLALGLGAWALGTLVGLAPSDVPRLEAVHLGPEVLAFLLAQVGAGTVLFALVPMAVQRGIRADDPAGSGRTIAGGPRRSGRNALVALQFAMAVVLLVGAAFVMRSAASLATIDLGFDDERVLTFRLPFPWQEIQSAEPGSVATPLYDRLAERLESIPGVEAVGYGSCVPLSPACSWGGTTLRRADVPPGDGELPVAGLARVSPGFLETLGVPLRTGRGLEPADHRQRTDAVLVSSSLAERFWPEGDAVGGRLVQDGRPEWGTLEVVGVVGDLVFDDLREGMVPMAWVPVLGPTAPRDLPNPAWVVRASVPPLSIARLVRQEVAELRPDLPVASMVELRELVADDTASLRLVMWLLGLSSAAATLMSAVGVYGVVAYVVNRRRGEIGIRMALGARAGQVEKMVLLQGSLAAGVGLLLGLAASLAIARFVGSMLHGVRPFDPVVYLGVGAALGATALGAAFLPARRAARLDPSSVLRIEG